MEDRFKNHNRALYQALRYLGIAWAIFFLTLFASLQGYLPLLWHFSSYESLGSLGFKFILSLGFNFLINIFLGNAFKNLSQMESPACLVPLYSMAGLTGWLCAPLIKFCLQCEPQALRWLALAGWITLLSIGVQALSLRWQRDPNPSAPLYFNLVWWGVNLLIFVSFCNVFWLHCSGLEMVISLALMMAYQFYLQQTFRALRHQSLNAYSASWPLFISSFNFFLEIFRFLVIYFSREERGRRKH